MSELSSLALAEAWRGGYAWRVLADDGQAGWIQRHRDGEGASVWAISRQRGKSFAAMLHACSLAIERPGSILRYAAKTKESAEGILIPTLEQILETCPAELRPKLGAPIEFPNGSTLWWAGTDAQSFDRLRGPRSHLIILDEAAFYQDLPKVEAALLPSLQTTGGKALYLSSPPESPAHEFKARFESARAADRSERSTIHDNPRLGPEGVARIANAEAKRLGLTVEQLFQSTYWRREYLAEFVVESSRAAVPAWEAHCDACVADVERPAHYDAYVGADFGFEPDPTGLLWGWYDIATSTVVIEREAELRAATIRQTVEFAKATERELYGADRFDGTMLAAAELTELPEWLVSRIHAKAPRQPYLRAADAPKQTLAEISGEHGYALLPVHKADKRVHVDALNDLVLQHRLKIHPRCVRLREQLATTLWNRTRTEWERSTQGDHGDLVDALVYLVREIRWHRDPRPPVNPTDSAAFRPTRRTSPLAGLGRRLF